MAQSYTTGGDALQSIGHQYYAAQSFTPEITHNLDCIDINLRTIDPTRAPTLWVYLADAEHKPTGDFLSKSIRSFADDWNLYNVFRMRAIMESTLLSAGIEYVIVIHAFALDQAYHMQWQYDNNDATYPRGIRLISNDDGETWDPHPGDDHIFAEFGTAPLPPPPPDPPTTKWFIVTIEQTITATGYIIVVTTNVPCHLWMRWTTVVPKEHPIQRTKRGLPLMLEKYYCFDVYEDNEQEEAGDTLEHTFIKEPWPFCETRYFYFQGEIAGVASNSTTAIFTKHRIRQPITTIFYPDPHPEVTSFDGYAGHNENLFWPALRTAAGNVKDDSGITIVVGFQSSGTPDKYNVMRRAIILFDTSVIPAGSTIQSATLGIWGVAKFDTFPIAPGLVVVSSNPLSNIAIAFADYLNLGNIALSDVIAYADFTLGVLNTFTLNAAGRNAIAPAGITKLGVREGNYERPNIEPTWSSGKFALFQFNASEEGGIYRPKLTVTYTPPP